MFEFIEIANAGVISDAPRVSALGLNVLNFLLSVFGVLAIIMLTVAGVKYFFSAGSETRLESAKKATAYVIIGIAVALGALIIVRQVIDLLE